MKELAFFAVDKRVIQPLKEWLDERAVVVEKEDADLSLASFWVRLGETERDELQSKIEELERVTP